MCDCCDDCWIDELHPLVAAAAQGDLARVTDLVALGEAADRDYADGWSPLHAAALRGHHDVVAFLLSVGAPVDQADDDGVTALVNAATRADRRMIELLLSAPAASPAFREADVNAAFHRAAEWGNVAALRALLDAGALRDAPDRHGFTALMWASENGHVPLVEFLLGLGVDSQARTTGFGIPPPGATARDLAAGMEHERICALLDREAERLQVASAADGPT